MKRSLALSVVCALLLSACSHTQLTDRERQEIVNRYRLSPYELAQSLWVTPFFRDDSKRLLLRVPPAEDILLVTPKGEPILPGPPEGVLPAGTKVVATRVTFPGGWEDVSRALVTPRDRMWLELTVEGKPAGITYVLVLPPDLKNGPSVLHYVSSFLSEQQVAREVARLSPADQHAITTKELAAGTSARGLELAFGEPLRREIHGDGTTRLEDWTWRSDTMNRVAHLKDGVVESVETKALAP
jgi:hypothetical protein